MKGLARRAALLNELLADLERIESLLRERHAVMPLANIRALKSKHASVSRRLARLEARLK